MHLNTVKMCAYFYILYFIFAKIYKQLSYFDYFSSVSVSASTQNNRSLLNKRVTELFGWETLLLRAFIKVQTFRGSLKLLFTRTDTLRSYCWWWLPFEWNACFVVLRDNLGLLWNCHRQCCQLQNNGTCKMHMNTKNSPRILFSRMIYWFLKQFGQTLGLKWGQKIT